MSRLRNCITEFTVIKNKFNINSYQSLRKHTESLLIEDSNQNPEFIYIFKYRNRTDKAEEDLDNTIYNINLIIDLIEKNATEKKVNNQILSIKKELINLLEESEDLEKNILSIDEIEIWKNNIKEFFQRYKFKIENFKSDFQVINKIKYAGILFSNGIEKPCVNKKTAIKILKSLRELLIRVIIALNKHKETILIKIKESEKKKVRQ